MQFFDSFFIRYITQLIEKTLFINLWHIWYFFLQQQEPKTTDQSQLIEQSRKIQQLENRKSDLEAELAQMRMELKTKNQNFDVERLKHLNEIDSLKAANQQLSEKVSQLTSEISNVHEKMETLKKNHENQISEVKKQYENVFRLFPILKINSKNSTRYASLNYEQQQLIQKQGNGFAMKYAEEKSKLQSYYDNLIEEQKVAIEKLNDEIKQLKKSQPQKRWLNALK